MINKKDEKQRGMDEIHEIMFLFRGENATRDGDYRSTHLGAVLEYLKSQKSEDKMVTLQKLAIVLGLSQRQVRENYIDGLIAWGIIGLESDCKRWFWVGIAAIKNQYGKLRKNEGEQNKYVADELAQTNSENPIWDEREKQKKEQHGEEETA